MNEKVEYVEVTLKLPRAVTDFLKAMNENIEDYLGHSILCAVNADIDTPGVFSNPGAALRSHDLVTVFQKHGIPLSPFLTGP